MMAKTNPADYLFIVAPMALTVYGQLILKWRMMQLPPFAADAAGTLGQMFRLVFDPAIFSGLLAAFFASLIWMGALKRFEFGFAYPFMSLNFAIAVTLSWWLFDEHLSVQRMVGLALIVAGTAVAARG
ncbi:MAG: rane protein [Rhodoferax sp.]|nr:rane protein [Rhodoferax sp.]